MTSCLGRIFLIILALLPLAFAQDKDKKPAAATALKSAIHFRDIAAEAGLTAKPKSSHDRRYIVDTMNGGGVALLDCDNDGKLDIAVVNDSTIDTYLAGGEPMVTLYHQDSDATGIHFTDITKSSGLTAKGWGTALAVADFDNDGLPDIYVTGFGHNVLYHNLGGCKFEDVTKKAGLEVGGFSTGAAWADYDRDGHVDLFVARYVDTDIHHLPDPKLTMGYKGVLVEVPDTMKGETDFLFRNRGDGTFEDVSARAKVNDPARQHGMGVVWGDYDGDGWPDLYVTNDSGWDYLYKNKHDGTFDEIGMISGAGTGASGELFGNMAADFGDFDRDGKLDLFVTRYGNQPASLYWNKGDDQFQDIALPAGIADPSFRPVKWGTGFGDFDNDGWPDIVVANGNFTSLMDTLPGEVHYREPMQLYRNKGNRTFEEIGDAAGLNPTLESRRGTALGDINNDGNLDVLVFNVDGPPSLFLNETHNGNHRVLFKLVGHKSNRAAIGARMLVTTSTMTQIDEVKGGNSYNSSSDWRLHFGLGQDASMKKVEVRWPSGQDQTFENVAADAIYQIDEGQGIKKIAALPKP
jgi:enediyne biosynthesis protein E4